MPTWLVHAVAASAAAWRVGPEAAVVPPASRRLDRLRGAQRPAPRPRGRRSGVRGEVGCPAGRARAAASDTLHLPLFVDLVAAGLAAGATVHEALVAVTRRASGSGSTPTGWRPVCAALSMGAAPESRLGGAAGRRRACARWPWPSRRAATSGAPAADMLSELAADLRARRRAAATEAARSVGVRAVAPLGLCFLPAFVLLGVVPTVVGLARAALTGG